MRPYEPPVTQSASTAVLMVANGCYVSSNCIVGILLVLNSLPVALTCGALAILVDLDVNRITIKDGLKKMFERDYLLLRLARYRLLELHEKNKKIEFFIYYKYLYDKYQNLKRSPLSNAAELYNARKDLHILERHFAYSLLNNSMSTEPLFNDVLLDDDNYALNFQNNFYRNQRLTRASWVISVTAGVGTGFITAYSTHTALLALLKLLHISMASSNLFGIILPIAICASIWFAITTYNNLHHIIVDKSLQKKWQEIKAFFDNQNKHVALKILMAVGLTLILALGIFMTIATAGTWWYGVGHGAKLLPFLKNIIHYLISIIVPCVALAAFLFNFNNFLESVWDVQRHIVKTAWQQNNDLIRQSLKQESWVLFLNPFRFIKIILESLIKLFLFIGHIISMGAMADRMPHVNPVAPMMAGLLCEAGEDAHFLMKGPGVLTYTVAIALLPITLLDALWRWAFKHTHTVKEKQQGNFCDFFAKSWGIEHEINEKILEPEVSEEFRTTWNRLKREEGLTSLRDRYSWSLHPLAREKKRCVEAFMMTKDFTEEGLATFKNKLAEKRWGLFDKKDKQTHGIAVLNALPMRG